MKDYYQILGVRQRASQAEIRRAYRLLVQKLHPDVNPDPTAHELIKEVNEAYDVLSNESRKREYDNRFETPYVSVDVSQQPAHRDPRYRRSKTTNNRTSGYYTQTELMQRYLPYMLWFCRAGIMFVLVLFIDKILPSKTIVDDVTNIYTVYRGKHRAYMYDIVETGNGLNIKMYEHNAAYFYEERKIKVEYTPILRIATSVSRENGSNMIFVGSIYRALIFWPVLLLTTSALGVLFRRKVEFSFSLCTVSGVFLFINLYLI